MNRASDNSKTAQIQKSRTEAKHGPLKRGSQVRTEAQRPARNILSHTSQHIATRCNHSCTTQAPCRWKSETRVRHEPSETQVSLSKARIEAQRPARDTLGDLSQHAATHCNTHAFSEIKIRDWSKAGSEAQRPARDVYDFVLQSHTPALKAQGNDSSNNRGSHVASGPWRLAKVAGDLRSDFFCCALRGEGPGKNDICTCVSLGHVLKSQRTTQFTIQNNLELTLENFWTICVLSSP